jgi:hypothetical protein
MERSFVVELKTVISEERLRDLSEYKQICYTLEIRSAHKPLGLSCAILFRHNSMAVVEVYIFRQDVDLSETFCTLFSSLF